MGTRKTTRFHKRRLRVRNRLRSSSRGRLRLSVFRSNRHISAQLIDDQAGRTLASASSLEKTIDVRSGGGVTAASAIGTVLAERATAAGFRECYFDRGGYRYHGRIRALAEAARAGGLQF
ncbi:MAG: 50S ribosomal protein L18 [Rhodobacteraceae bacterium]|nr:50S ribosomal protein L18 [Paracoccaceae bacterium]